MKFLCLSFGNIRDTNETVYIMWALYVLLYGMFYLIHLYPFYSRVHLCVQGTWVWTDGSAWNYQNWWGGQPNDGPTGNCVYLDTDETWMDTNCFSRAFFVCKMY
jgi:hypothetical protein